MISNDIIFPILLFISIAFNVTALPEVQLPLGRLRGKFLTSRNGDPYEAYMGIPYGELHERFGISHPITTPWNGTVNSTEFGPHCAQSRGDENSTLIGSEDCLFINVFTQSSDTSQKRPVLFYIHGGGFNMGTGSVFGADFLMDEDLILVTFNYRVGILGFLNIGNVYGNMGLKDQLLALQWVHENIEYFGGDKTKVTISGASAGSASTIYMLLAPAAKGLFHNAIPFSGSPLSPWAYVNNSTSQAEKVGTYLNCGENGNQSLVNCLRATPIDVLIRAQSSLREWFMDPMALFPPTLEIKDASNPSPFLEASPADLIAAGNFTRVPILATMNRDEGVVIWSGVVIRTEAMRTELDEDFSRVAPITFNYRNGPVWALPAVAIQNASAEIRHFYFGNQTIDFPTEDNLTNLYTDTWFMCGIHQTALKLGQEMPVYMGIFAHVSKHFSLTQNFGIEEILGVGHGDEASYIFNPVTDDPPNQIVFELVGSSDIAFSKKIVKLVAHFAENSVPDAVEYPNWKTVSSQEVASNSLNWLALDLETELLINPFFNRIDFWNNL